MDNIQIAVAHQPLANNKNQTLISTLEQLKNTSFDGYELSMNFPRNPFLLQNSMKSQGIQVSSAPFHSHFTEDHRYTSSINQFIDHMHFLNAINTNTVIVCECGHNTFETDHAIISDKPIFKAQQWEMLISGLVKIAGYAKENNMRIVYQPHLGTGVKTEADIDRLMKATKAGEVSLLIDTGHLAALGINPNNLIKKYADRIHYIHLKDVERNILNKAKKSKMSYSESFEQRLFTTPGQGFINFESMYKLLNKQRYRGWLVIHSDEGTQKTKLNALAKNARKYFK